MHRQLNQKKAKNQKKIKINHEKEKKNIGDSREHELTINQGDEQEKSLQEKEMEKKQQKVFNNRVKRLNQETPLRSSRQRRVRTHSSPAGSGKLRRQKFINDNRRESLPGTKLKLMRKEIYCFQLLV